MPPPFDDAFVDPATHHRLRDRGRVVEVEGADERKARGDAAPAEEARRFDELDDALVVEEPRGNDDERQPLWERSRAEALGVDAGARDEDGPPRADETPIDEHRPVVGVLEDAARALAPERHSICRAHRLAERALTETGPRPLGEDVPEAGEGVDRRDTERLRGERAVEHGLDRDVMNDVRSLPPIERDDRREEARVAGHRTTAAIDRERNEREPRCADLVRDAGVARGDGHVPPRVPERASDRETMGEEEPVGVDDEERSLLHRARLASMG